MSPAALPFIPLIASGVGAAAGLYSGHQQAKQNAAVQAQMQQTQQKQMGLFDQANQQIPGMQNLANQYGQGTGGFLYDRARSAALDSQYAPLMDQMQRLYNGSFSSNTQASPEAQGMWAERMGDDGGAAAMLRSNAQSVLSATDPSVYQAQARLAGNDALDQMSNQLAARGIASSGSASRLGASTLSRLYSDAAARGQQDRLNAYGLSNSAAGAAGNLSLQSGQQRMAAYGQQFNQDAARLSQQTGLLGSIANLIGARQQGISQQSGLLGNYLQGLQGQYGMEQGIANQYNNQAAALGGVYNQQAQQINPNPYGGFAASLGAFGNAGANYVAQRQMTPTFPATYQFDPKKYIA